MRPSSTVRISDRSHRTLKELARTSGQPMQAILEHAIEEERRCLYFDRLHADYQRLRSDPEAWEEHQAERALWDNTLKDGPENEPPYDQPPPPRQPVREQ